jgi:hypothetical protein
MMEIWTRLFTSCVPLTDFSNFNISTLSQIKNFYNPNYDTFSSLMGEPDFSYFFTQSAEKIMKGFVILGEESIFIFKITIFCSKIQWEIKQTEENFVALSTYATGARFCRIRLSERQMK